MFRYIKTILPQQRQRQCFWLVILILLSFYPYEIANAYYPISTADIRAVFVVCILLTPISLFCFKKKLPSAFITCVLIMVIGTLLSFLLTGHKYYYHKLICLYAAICLIIIVYNSIGLRQFYLLYNKWILIMALLGCVCLIISLAGIPPFTSFIAKEDGRTVYSWFISFTKTPPAGFIRYSGFFDEPGAMGYWGCFALGINRLFVKDRRLEKLLLILLLFTFSMGYIMQAIAFIFFFLLSKSSRLDRLLILSFVIVLCVGIVSTRGTSYSFFYDESIGRIEQMFQGGSNIMSFEGTSRERLVAESRIVFQSHPVWGIGWPIDNQEYIGDNYYETLAHDGIVGTIYQYFPYLLLLFWAISRRDYETVGIVIFLSLAVFHRPIHPNILTYFIFYSLPLLYSIKVKEDKLKKPL